MLAKWKSPWRSRRSTRSSEVRDRRASERPAQGHTDQQATHHTKARAPPSRPHDQNADRNLNTTSPQPCTRSLAQIHRTARQLRRDPPCDRRSRLRPICPAGHRRRTSTELVWHAFGLQPWRTETFKVSPDPFLIDKIRDIVSLYLAPPANAVVFAVDEKPQIQALQRTAPVLPMIPGVPERRSFDYVRHGTVDLFAALNTLTGKVITRLSAQHRAVDFRDFLDEIDCQTDKGLEVHVICDNLSTHKAPVVHKWLLAHPRFQLHFTPTYSSWINQVERWFAELERRCLARGVFCSLETSRPHSKSRSRSGTTMPGPSNGPRQPTRSSTASAANATGSPNQVTSSRATRTRSGRWWITRD
ncbi:IS630 family transposase [Streptomyces sp. NPDC005803]|uniref:IS630 family transposase n=1 Tax=Streptomyces sp. NPDC005803 TaxID=3154297 RepID=UPI0033F96501